MKKQLFFWRSYKQTYPIEYIEVKYDYQRYIKT